MRLKRIIVLLTLITWITSCDLSQTVVGHILSQIETLNQRLRVLEETIYNRLEYQDKIMKKKWMEREEQSYWYNNKEL